MGRGETGRLSAGREPLVRMSTTERTVSLGLTREPEQLESSVPI